jgi:hypothetical protein
MSAYTSNASLGVSNLRYIDLQSIQFSVRTYLPQSFAVVSLLVSTILEFSSLLLFHRVGLNYISAGPATLIFSILYQYWRIFPSSYHFRIFGLPLNNKSFLYILVLQV